MSGHVPILTTSTMNQKIQKPIQTQHSSLRSKCIYMQRSKGMANSPYVTGIKPSNSSRFGMRCNMNNVTEPSTERFPKRGITESSKTVNVQSQFEREQIESDWDYADLEEGISKVAKSAKCSVVLTRLSGRRTHNTDNQIEETKSLCGVDIASDIGRRRTEKVIGNCKCKKDHFLPCCSKAARWIRLLFTKSGKKFNYRNCKSLYEV